MLSLNGVEVRYVKVILVLKGVSLEVQEGHIVCLLGANGAGKSTTLKAISGLLASEEGEISGGYVEFSGERINGRRANDIVKLGIVQVMEGHRVFEHATVEENLIVGSHLRSDRSAIADDLAMVYQYFPRLRDLRNKTSGYASGGEQQMVVIGRALMARPKVLLLDEPSLGLAPLMVEDIFSVIKKINEEQKTTILLVEQNARAALAIANYAYVLENGRVVLDGPASVLKDNEDIREFYLGLNREGGVAGYHEVKHYKRRKRWLG